MATLVYSDADGVDRSLSLGSEPVMVGRSAECMIRSEDPRVSRMHARFYVDQGALWIEDLGSANGIYVGPNRVTRAPVPTGEIILVGSLMIRLLPASGTLPPPMGLHGTLATWLDLERKTRAAVEEERNAFARRVNELHQQLATVQSSRTLEPDAGATAPAMVADGEDLVRLRGELATARDRIVVLERERVQWSSPKADAADKQVDELAQLKSYLEEATAVRGLAEHAQAEAARELATLRDELDALRRTSNAELETLRADLAKAHEATLMAETAAGVATAEKLAEADTKIAALRQELADARLAFAQAAPDTRLAELTTQLMTVSGRVEKAEKDLAAAQIRAQGAERNLSHASAQAAKAETRASQLEHKLADSDIRAKSAESDLVKARERIAALETRIGAGNSPVQAAEQRAAKLATDLAEMTNQFEARRDRLTDLEKQLEAAKEQAKQAEARAKTASADVATASMKLAEAEARATALQAKLDGLDQAESKIAAASKTRDDAAQRIAEAEKRIVESTRRADDAEKRASAADTMAKAMAKDVAEALRRAAEADTRYRSTSREIGELVRRAEQAEARSAEGLAAVAEAQQRVAAADAKIVEVEKTFAAQFATKSKELAAKYEATQIDLSTKLAIAEKELATKVEALQRDLGGKLTQVQRELAAERSSSLSLVDRKTQLERELADVRKDLPAIVKRSEAAEKRAREYQVQVETLQDRVTDLESGLAVGETAYQATLAELREEIRGLKVSLGEAKAAVEKAEALARQLRGRVDVLEKQLAETTQAKSVAEHALREAHDKIAELERAAAARDGADHDDRSRLEDALARAGEAERKIEALTVRAEAADLAIGRAGALQRQLDEAIQKLSFIERESASKARDTARSMEVETVTNERIASADKRAHEAENRAVESESRAAEAERRASEADKRATDAESRAAEIEKRARTTADQIAELQNVRADLERRLQRAEDASRSGNESQQRAADDASRRATDADRRATDAERRAANAEQRASELTARIADAEQRARDMAVRVAEAEQRSQQASMRITELEQQAQISSVRKIGPPSSALERQLFDAKARITQLEREVESAENVRSFAAETEREIANLRRELREARTKLVQTTGERDQLASQLRDARGDSETTSRRAPLPPNVGAGSRAQPMHRDSETTANLDVRRIEAMVQRTDELERKVKRLEAIEVELRAELREAEKRAVARTSSAGALDDAESTQTRPGKEMNSVLVAEHVSILEESIDSLRANMRAASDETAIMPQSDSVMAVSSAVSQAAEHIERARSAVRALAKQIGMSS